MFIPDPFLVLLKGTSRAVDLYRSPLVETETVVRFAPSVIAVCHHTIIRGRCKARSRTSNSLPSVP